MQKILIVDDDNVTAKIYCAALEKRGYLVEITGNGASTVQRVVEFRPDALLLDLMLPDTNGLDLLELLRNSGHLGGVPVIAYTNAYVPHLVEVAKKAGARCVFDKSLLSPFLLAESFREALQGASNEQRMAGDE